MPEVELNHTSTTCLISSNILTDFRIFSAAQLSSKDIDPVYPVLKSYLKSKNLSREQAIWWLFLYVAFYHIGSACSVFNRFPFPEVNDIRKQEIVGYRTGIERRGFRGTDVGKNYLVPALEYIIENHNNLSDFVKSSMSKEYTPEVRWISIRNRFEEIKNNGSWASYKWADLLKNVLDYPITANNIGIGGNGKNSSPVNGLVVLTGKDWNECARNFPLQKQVYRDVQNELLRYSGMEEFETNLCDFNGLVKGHYYMGHDIDLMMNQLLQITDIVEQGKFWEIRRQVFKPEYLGEMNNYFGVRRELKTAYRDKALMVNIN